MTEVEPDSGTASVTSGGASAVGPAGCGGGNGDGDDVDRKNHLVGANRSEYELGDDAGAQELQEDDVVATPPTYRVNGSTSVDWVWVSSDHSATNTTGAASSAVSKPTVTNSNIRSMRLASISTAVGNIASRVTSVR